MVQSSRSGSKVQGLGFMAQDAGFREAAGIVAGSWQSHQSMRRPQV